MATVSNVEPMDLRELARVTDLSLEEALEYVDKLFGSYADYVRACDSSNGQLLADRLEKLGAK